MPNIRTAGLAGTFAATLAAGFCAMLMTGLVHAQTISWGPVQTATITSPYVGVVLGAPDNSTGGFSFTTGGTTRYGTDADMVISNRGTIGATGVTFSRADFLSSSEADPGGYLPTLRIGDVGDVFVIQMKDGRHAKIRIDSLPAGIAWYTYNEIGFSYRIETPGSNSSSTVSYMIDCAKDVWPGSMTCGTPQSLGRVYSAYDADGALTWYGCSLLDYGIYYCSGGTPIPGVWIIYTWDTGDVSRVFYIH